jgi:hypothetical protein
MRGDVLSGLVNAALASKLVERVGHGADAVDITRGWEITPTGRQASMEVRLVSPDLVTKNAALVMSGECCGEAI